MILYLVYIVYSFLIIFILYICLILYKKCSYLFYNTENKIITSEKYSEKKLNKYNNSNNTSNKIKILKNKFRIKSTEKTKKDIKFISQIPNYINNNDINKILLKKDIDIKTINDLKKFDSDELTQKIIKTYLNTKYLFHKFFLLNNGEYKIKTLIDYYNFHKDILNKDTKYNILLKFYNNDKYLYLYVIENKMIKIVNCEDYNNICTMIEQNNGIFMLKDKVLNNYYISYGGYTKSQFNSDDIKKVFFHYIKNEEKNDDKNYKILCDFENIKIYFYISTLVN
jgi:hypothetical protein